ncbi:hypothetical protein AAMO2058_000205200 [Amorphochlora amoebiformis]
MEDTHPSIGEDFLLARRVRYAVGIRMRFTGKGGCSETKVYNGWEAIPFITSNLASAEVIISLGAIVLALGTRCFLYVHNIPEVDIEIKRNHKGKFKVVMQSIKDTLDSHVENLSSFSNTIEFKRMNGTCVDKQSRLTTNRI